MKSVFRIVVLSFLFVLVQKSAHAQEPGETPSASEPESDSAASESGIGADASDGRPESPPEGAESPKSVTPKEKTAKPRAHRGRMPNGLGAIGLDRTLSAHVGVVDTVRLRGSVGGFSTSDFPISGADNGFIQTVLSIGYTPTDVAELYFAILGTSNTNSLGKPDLIQTQGDLSFGGKLITKVSPSVAAGGALRLKLLSDVGTGGIAWNGTSAELTGLLSVDLEEAQNDPIRFNLNLGYYFENSDNLDNGLSQEPTLIQEFGLQTARYDRLTLALGLEVPLEQPLIPFVEYEVTLPILVELARRSEDSNDYSFFSIPHSVALGLRGFVTDNIALEGVVRIGLSDQPYTGVPATPPWMVTFALSYHLDPLPQVIEKIVEVSEVRPVLDQKKRFEVLVSDEVNKKPISNAQLLYLSPDSLSGQLSDMDGRITSYELPSGTVRVRISADGFLPEELKVQLDGDDKEPISVVLKKDPADQRGTVELLIQNEAGKPLPATVQFGGKARNISGQSDVRGSYQREMSSGTYPVLINARGYQEVSRTVGIKPNAVTKVVIKLESIKSQRMTPATSVDSPAVGGSSLAVVTTKGIRLKRKLSFVRNTAELTADSLRVLDSLARGLNRVTAIKKVQIGVHTGGRGAMAAQMELSRDRAKQIKAYLVNKNVDRKRIRVRGFGASKPLAPPLTKRGRQKNQRVEFTIIKVQ